MSKRTIHRRRVLQTLAAGAAAGVLGASRLGRPRRARAQSPAGPSPRFLIVLGGFGGASIIDSFLPVRESESAAGTRINAYPDGEVKDVADTPIRAVDHAGSAVGALPTPFDARHSEFLARHKQDMMVVTQTVTSVNHAVAQKRSITGNGAWQGRTLQEAVALAYGEGSLIPNVNMSTLGFLEHGDDPTLPAYCYNEAVSQPALWPLGLDGSRGILGAPERDLVALARQVRDDRLDPGSPFYQTFRNSERLARWQTQRRQQAAIEAQDLITRLNVFPDLPPNIPLSEYGLASSPEGARVRQAFPAFASDPLEAQAALAFLLLKYRVAVTVTLSPSFALVLPTQAGVALNPPLAFDYAHNAHRGAQAVMWQRILSLADRLITLLQAEEFDPTTGESMWDRTLIYVATEFGRSKGRPDGADDFGTGHDLNNGNLIISPLVNGNTVLGGVDPDTGLTYGFDPQTGAPEPGRTMTEAEIYAGILQALGVDTSGSGLPDVPAMRRG
ncbi:hypothetical protein [Haliangium sp.]|uniref:hypothetical protein n=1 Tax=Haliangium sp. TaxID=2663208 RepID=UPI003D0DA39A